LGIVEQELDESALGCELLIESDIVPQAKLAELIQEADELLRIIVTATKTTKRRKP
jgi:hypothetical protein